MCEWVIARLGELVGFYTKKNIIVSGYFIFQGIFRCIFRGLDICMSVGIIGETIPKVE